MDLKALLNKLDKLDQRQVLLESSAVMEEVLSAELELLKESYIALMERVRGRELEELRKVKDENERKTQLAALATKNGYPGMFDPVTGKWVDNQGNFAWFGPYKAEVEKMEKDGLVPPEAHTSAFWGVMGKDKDEAFKASSENKSRYELIDGSEDIIDKANQSKKPDVANESVVKGSIARALTEGFGYSFSYIAESITEPEHNTLKANIEKLNDPIYKDDKEVQAVLFKYQEYVKYRDQLIAKIKDAVAKVTALKTPAATLHEARSVLKEEIYLVPHSDNTVSAIHFYLDESGNVVEYVITEDVEALGRGLMNGVTFGWGDNAVAKMISMYKGTPYGEELAKQLAATEAAKKRSPVWYWGGNIAGGMAYGGTGLVRNAAVIGTQYASDKYLRDPHNASELEKNANSVKKVQKSVSAPANGKMDPATVSAVQKNAAPVSAPAVVPTANNDLENVFKAFGVKDMNELKAKLKQAGVNNYDKLGQTIANTLQIPAATATASESIIYSSMSESERMSYLRNRMSQIDEAANPIPIIAKFFGLGAEAFLAKTLAALGKDTVTLGGTIWKKGATGYWEGGGKIIPADDLAQLIKSEMKANPKGFAAANAPAKPKINIKPGETPADAVKRAQQELNPAKPVPTTKAPPATPTAAPTAVQATAMAEKLAAQYPKTAAVLKGIGAVARFGWNHKWWTAMAAIIAAGYLTTNTEPEPTTDPAVDQKVDPNKPKVDQKADPNAIDPQKQAEIQKYSLNIKKWMDQLVAMYPADKETKDIQAEVEQALKGLPQPAQVDQKAQPNSATGTVTNAYGYQPPTGGYAGNNSKQ